MTELSHSENNSDFKESIILFDQTISELNLFARESQDALPALTEIRNALGEDNALLEECLRNWKTKVAETVTDLSSQDRTEAENEKQIAVKSLKSTNKRKSMFERVINGLEGDIEVLKWKETLDANLRQELENEHEIEKEKRVEKEKCVSKWNRVLDGMEKGKSELSKQRDVLLREYDDEKKRIEVRQKEKMELAKEVEEMRGEEEMIREARKIERQVQARVIIRD